MTAARQIHSGASSPAPRCVCPACGAPVTADRLVIDHHGNSVSRGGRLVRLTARETDILVALKQAYPRTLSTADLGDAVWGMIDDAYHGDVIATLCSTIRAKTASMGFTIETVWGRGRRLRFES